MKRMKFIIFLSLMGLALLSACTVKPPYPVQSGAYGLEEVFITDKITKETTEKNYDNILNDKEWSKLYIFSVSVNDNTEYLYSKDNRCFFLNVGLAYEVIGENKLQLHFNYWLGNNGRVYDIVIILNCQTLYG